MLLRRLLQAIAIAMIVLPIALGLYLAFSTTQSVAVLISPLSSFVMATMALIWFGAAAALWFWASSRKQAR